VGQDAQTYTNNKTSEITGAHRSGVANDTLNQRFTDLESVDTTINNSIDAIEARLDDIDGNESGTIHSRLAAVETEIDNANNDGTLNDRFEAIEDDIAAINGVNGTIAGLDTRIGALETEVDMTSANSRIDVLANEISNAHRTNVDTLDDRFDAVELRVTTLENDNSSSTVVISDATYTPQGLPIIDNPDENVDYLIKKGDKYYYWKYIKTSSDPDVYTWELISGGGGSGSGNSNEEDYETYNAFELATKETNKDYYVLQSDGIRHHYRYLQSTNANEETVWTRIEIGIPTNTLKSYQIARSQEIDE
jgi:archaellum component FlaC